MIGREDKPIWWNLLWFSKTIPRHAFFELFIIHSQLKIDRLMIWGIVMDTQLVLYKSRKESRNHFLIFNALRQKGFGKPFFFLILFLEKGSENSGITGFNKKS